MPDPKYAQNKALPRTEEGRQGHSYSDNTAVHWAGEKEKPSGYLLALISLEQVEKRRSETGDLVTSSAFDNLGVRKLRFEGFPRS